MKAETELPPTARDAEERVVILASKLSHPRLPSALVARERLLSSLDAALSRQLILVSASGGWGKTTLLSAWVKRHAHPVAWLSLDELDNTPTRFWTSVIVALRTCLPSVGEIAISMLHSLQPQPLSTILTTLLNEVQICARESILILDDYHVIEEQTIHEALLFFIEHLPANLHLVLASRVDPPLPLSRWRVRGQMFEVRDEDLRFTEEEASSFLRQGMDLTLSEEEVGLLGQRTEGWIAGLQLAALAMQKRTDFSAFIRAFTGSHRYLLEYVQEDILARLPEALQDFLLQTSVLSRLSASLCQAVTEEAASQELLETIERANLFLVPLDEERRWYRFHDLFREALLARLHATRAELIPLLHQRAARWHEAEGNVHEAVTHALSAKDYAFATSLMERSAEHLWMHGEAETVHSWIKALPEIILHDHLRLALTAALRLIQRIYPSASEEQQVATLAQMEQTIARVERLLRNVEQTSAYSETYPEAEKVLLRNRILLLRGWSTMSKVIRTGEREQLRLLSQQMQPMAMQDDMTWNIILLFISIILSSSDVGNLPSLIPLLQEAKKQASVEQKGYELMRVGQWLAMAHHAAGNLHQAQRECLEALDLAGQEYRQVSTIYLHLSLASLYRMWNRGEEAEAHLQEAWSQAHSRQRMLALDGIYAEWIEAALDAGDVAGAEKILREIEQLVQQKRLVVLSPSLLIHMRVRLWIAQGNVAAVNGWVTREVFNLDELSYSRLAEYLALVRVYLAQHQYEKALQWLTRLRSRSEQDGRMRDVVHIQALQIVALLGLKEYTQARHTAAHLLTLTEPEGYVRLYLEAGSPMKRLLQSLLNEPLDQEHDASAPLSRSYISTLLTAFEQKEQQRALEVNALAGKTQEIAQQIPALAGPAVFSASPTLIEPLTSQEQRVLRLLAAGHSNQEIASLLVVSLNTVKTHVKNLYSKLNVNSRAQASELARKLDLLAF